MMKGDPDFDKNVITWREECLDGKKGGHKPFYMLSGRFKRRWRTAESRKHLCEYCIKVLGRPYCLCGVKR